MRYSKQSLGGSLIIIMDSLCDDEIRRTFDSFFHHGAIGSGAKLHWTYQMDGGGKAYFLVDGKTPQGCKDKLLRAYMMMKTYRTNRAANIF